MAVEAMTGKAKRMIFQKRFPVVMSVGVLFIKAADFMTAIF